MSTVNPSITDVFEALKERSLAISLKEEIDKGLYTIFEHSLTEGVRNIVRGASASSFHEFVVASFIERAHREGYSKEQIEGFINKLK